MDMGRKIGDSRGQQVWKARDTVARIAITLLSLIFGVCAVSTGFAAENRLNGDQIRKLLAGGLDYSVDALHTTLRFSYSAKGKWSAFRPGGDEAWGEWKVDGDTLCRILDGPAPEPLKAYDPWNDYNLLPICFFVSLDGDRIVTSEFDTAVSLDDSSVLTRLSPPQAVAVARAKPAARQPEPTPAPAPVVSPAPVPAPAPVVTPKPAGENRSLTLERERLALEREKLAMEQAEADRQLEADRRELELLRLDLQRQRLQRERQALQQMRDVPQRAAGAGRDTIAPFIDVPALLETREEKLVVSGYATDNGRLTRVEMNGGDVAFNARDGAFSVRTGVPVGQSKIVITAFDSEGNKSEHVVTVLRSRDIPQIDYGNYHALVIGIDNYDALPKLNTAVADAREVARTLEANYGYSVHLLENATRIDIIDALDVMRETLDEDDNLLIYYAGHGWRDEQNGRGYWLPAGARTDRRSRWFSNASLTDALQALLAKHVMVVADSCYSGTLTRSAAVTAGSPDYIERMVEKRARVVLSSGGLEPVADSGGGKHSVFAKQFLTALRDNEGVLDGTQLFEQVRHKVVLNANQTPEYSDIRLAGHEGGDFLFVRKK